MVFCFIELYFLNICLLKDDSFYKKRFSLLSRRVMGRRVTQN